ncbi:MAG TPA: AbiV family abortive infection protein [Candidatus Acidoferrum sp.]|nr:AbiV family abortive infection protein [Candidatus Acidoferrum sp.]
MTHHTTVDSQNKKALAIRYEGELTAIDAANAIRAARLNAIDLFDTAEILFTLKRFPHSMAFSTLAIEESSKPTVLLSIFCAEDDQQRIKGWKSYRSHLAKTADLNKAIESRIRVTFPQIPREEAKRIGEAGPTPKELEYNKQLAVYSDCVTESAGFVCHCPGVSEWRQLAWERLCEAQALVHALRDRPPGELEIIRKHIRQRPPNGDPVLTLKELHRELLERGFVKEGWWDTLLEDMQQGLE